MEKILEILKNQKVNEYRIIEETVYAKEWFFIQKKLDMTRAKKVKYYYLTVYQTIYENTEKFKGSASCKLNAQEDDAVLNETIGDLIKAASLVKNPYFELPCPEEDKDSYQSSSIGDIHEVFEMMQDFHENENISLNSFELFENHTEVRIVNSKGIDVTYSYPSHELEMVINAKNQSHEVEIYQNLCFGQPNVAELKHQIGDARRQVLNRCEALSLKETPTRVIISKENVLEIFRYYLMQLNTERQYHKYSTIQIGDCLGPKGFHLEGLPYLENSSKNKAFDDDGRIVRPVVLVEEGKVNHVWGPHIFSRYMGMSDTTMIFNYKVAPGPSTIEDMKAEPYLEVVQFSNFSCQMITGDFSGEIRLGYYFDGQKIIPVTGGSISGNVKVCESDMVLSKELEKYDNAVVPSAILLSHVNIAL